MSNLIFSLNATMPIFLTMILGLFFRKVGILDESFTSKMNKFVFKIALPVLLFQDLSDSDFSAVGYQIRSVLLLCNTALNSCGMGTFPSLKREKCKRRIYPGGVPEQCGDPWYCLYPEYLWNLGDGAAYDRQCGAAL